MLAFYNVPVHELDYTMKENTLTDKEETIVPFLLYVLKNKLLSEQAKQSLQAMIYREDIVNKLILVKHDAYIQETVVLSTHTPINHDQLFHIHSKSETIFVLCEQEIVEHYYKWIKQSLLNQQELVDYMLDEFNEIQKTYKENQNHELHLQKVNEWKRLMNKITN